MRRRWRRKLEPGRARGVPCRLVNRAVLAEPLQDAIAHSRGCLRIAPWVGAAIADEGGQRRRLRQRQLGGGTIEVAARCGLDAAPPRTKLTTCGERIEELLARPRSRHPDRRGDTADAGKERGLEVVIAHVHARQVLHALNGGQVLSAVREALRALLRIVLPVGASASGSSASSVHATCWTMAIGLTGRSSVEGPPLARAHSASLRRAGAGAASGTGRGGASQSPNT